MLECQSYINGEFRNPHALDGIKINPSDEREVARFPIEPKTTVYEAVAAAKEAQKKWRSLSRVQRAEYFDKLCELMKSSKEDLVRMISFETGKSLNESAAEFVEALHMAQYTFGMGRMPSGSMVPSEIPTRDSYIIRKPKGVVAVISPWNFPLAIGGFWCAAPALLEGNTVVWKPSEDTPMIADLVAKLYTCFPPGVFNVVHGDGRTGEYLATHPDVDHICFTGSREVGNRIQRACAQHGSKSFSCETGSKSAVIVFDDADFDLALSATIASAYKLTGQRCVSAGRMLVQKGVFDKFIDEFVEASKRVTMGDPFQGEFTCGPLINKRQLKNVSDWNYSTGDGSAEVLLHGEKMDREGYFITPHVYTTEWNFTTPQQREMGYWCATKNYLHKEVFGPHVAIIPFDDLDQAVDIYNDTEFGLALGVITSDFKKAREIRERCDFGLGYWNAGSISAESHLPFSGVKGSGIGGASAAGTFDAVVNKVTWTVNHGPLVFPQGLKT